MQWDRQLKWELYILKKERQKKCQYDCLPSKSKINNKQLRPEFSKMTRYKNKKTKQWKQTYETIFNLIINQRNVN